MIQIEGKWAKLGAKKISKQMLALPAYKKNGSYPNGFLIQQDLYNSQVGGPKEALMFWVYYNNRIYLVPSKL
jgi:hypothetical protein